MQAHLPCAHVQDAHLQRLHNLSDERLQYPVSDRLSFMRFLDLELAGNVPDARIVWAFREALKQHPLTDALFERLNQALSNTEKSRVRARDEHVFKTIWAASSCAVLVQRAPRWGWA